MGIGTIGILPALQSANGHEKQNKGLRNYREYGNKETAYIVVPGPKQSTAMQAWLDESVRDVDCSPRRSQPAGSRHLPSPLKLHPSGWVDPAGGCAKVDNHKKKPTSLFRSIAHVPCQSRGNRSDRGIMWWKRSLYLRAKAGWHRLCDQAVTSSVWSWKPPSPAKCRRTNREGVAGWLRMRMRFETLPFGAGVVLLVISALLVVGCRCGSY
jgi:hypothetical protein